MNGILPIRNFAEGLRCGLGQLAGQLTAEHQRAIEKNSDRAPEFYWRAEGVRESIRFILAAADREEQRG